jgi:Zn-dependent peptidase ImmA (M78 family)
MFTEGLLPFFYFPQPPRHFKPLKDFRKFHHQYILTENEEYTLQKELILFQQKREIALELYEQLDSEPPQFRLKGTINQPPEKLAEKIIEYLGINHSELADIKPGYDALNYWKNLLESKGILVFQTSGVPLHIMRGACIAKDVLPVIITTAMILRTDGFLLFHELVHIVLRADGISNFRYRYKDIYDQAEVYCNQTSAELLVPSQYLLESHVVRSHTSHNPVWSAEELKKLSNRFCVSREVILRRLLTLEKTTNRFYQDFRDNQIISDKKDQTGGDYYRNVIAKEWWIIPAACFTRLYQDKVTASALSDFIKIKVSNLPKLETTTLCQSTALMQAPYWMPG